MRPDVWVQWGVRLSRGADEVWMRCRCVQWRFRWSQVRACIENGGMTDRSVTLPPPPRRRVPRHNSNTGERGRHPGGWSRAGTLGKPPGRVWGSGGHGGSGGSGGQGGIGDSGGHGGSGDSGSHDGTGDSGAMAILYFVKVLIQEQLWRHPGSSRWQLWLSRPGVYSPPPPPKKNIGDVPLREPLRRSGLRWALWWSRLWRSGHRRSLWWRAQEGAQNTHTHTHTHTYIYIYIYIENVLRLNQEHTLCWMNLLPNAFLEPHTSSKQVWVNQPKIQV